MVKKYTFGVSKISIEPWGQSEMRIEIEVDNPDEILEEIGETDIIYRRESALLDEIGIEEVKKYFDLVEKPEE
jgi:hypothetical protein